MNNITKPLNLIRTIVLLLIAFVSQYVSAAVDTPCVEIDTFPYEIRTPGVYCLSRSHTINVSGPAITVNAIHVVIDFKNHTIDNSQSTASSTGVFSNISSNLELRSGKLVGFQTGVAVGHNTNSGTTKIENMVISNARFGVKVVGGGFILNRNEIKDFSHTGITVDDTTLGEETIGGNIVSNNLIHSSSSPNNSVIAIYIESGSPSRGNVVVVKNNRVTNISGQLAYGITMTGNSRVLLTNNYLRNISGQSGSYGILCSGNGKWLLESNWLFSAGIPLNGCADNGSNTLTP